MTEKTYLRQLAILLGKMNNLSLGSLDNDD